jgi:hypothetical protein
VRRPWITAAGAAALGLLALGTPACGTEDTTLPGRWQNGTRQVLEIRPDLSGWLTQAATCTPTLEVDLERDPFGGWAIRFDDNQRIHYPPVQQRFFEGDSFCSTPGSKPMCNFCQLEETKLTCEPTKQEIVGSGVRITHDCTWLRVGTTSTSSIPPAACGRRARTAACDE